MDLLIFGGQSNMQGQTECDPHDSPVDGAMEYRLLADKLFELKNPVGEDIGDLLLSSHLGFGSLVPYFCEEYIKLTGNRVVAVHVAKGATVIDQWLKGSAAGKDRYDKALEKINGAKRAIGQADKIFYIWLQGESDALCGTTEEEYIKKLAKFNEDLKADANIDKFMIIEVGHFAYIEGKAANDKIIQSAQEKLCESEDFLMLTQIAKEMSLNREWLNPDAAGHFNNKAMRIIGQVAGAAAAAYRNSISGLNLTK